MTDTNTNPLEPANFYTENVQWVSASVQLLKTRDITDLHRDIAQRTLDAMNQMRDLALIYTLKGELTLEQREERKRLHQTLQVVVPALRRSTIFLRNLNASPRRDKAVFAAASRLAAFLLGMVAQSSLFPAEAKMNSMGAKFDATLPGGLTIVNRSVALHLLRDHAELFGPCPAWVELVVVYPKHMSAETAIVERHLRDDNLTRLALRNKIIDLGVLTADEEQLLIRVL